MCKTYILAVGMLIAVKADLFSLLSFLQRNIAFPASLTAPDTYLACIQLQGSVPTVHLREDVLKKKDCGGIKLFLEK